MANFNAVVEVSTLDGTNGFRIDGEGAYDLAGRSISDAGDVNGDGFADLIIGAYAADPNAIGGGGASYVVFGSDQGFPATLELSALDGTNGFQINGESRSDRTGFSVSGAGDVNDDGIADIIIGSRLSGVAYVVFGTDQGFDPNLELSALDGTNGFEIPEESNDTNLGHSVSGTGDVNGDGIDDFVVGAWTVDPNRESNAGASYLVFGTDQGFSATLDLSTLDGTNGVQINGEAAQDFSGYSVSGAGDVNGDGFADLIIGAYNADPNGSSSGASYVVFGRESFGPNLNLSALNGANGFQISGEAAGDSSGEVVSGAGDVNGDGFADLIVSANAADPNGDRSGASYVVFGKARGFAANLDLSALDGTNGFQISGEAASDSSGSSVSGAGDVNGDGFDDLIVSSPGADPNGDRSGSAYVVFGSDEGFPATLELSALDGTNGFQINGEAMFEGIGFSISSAGDVNGDGVDDLMVSSAFVADAGAGATYVIYGIQADLVREGTVQVDKLKGGSANDVLTGFAGDDGLNGFAGDDILTGGLGKDILKGGAGADTFVFETWNDSRRLAPDAIRDFSQAEDDKIDLSALDLDFLGPTPFGGDPGELRVLQGANATYVLADRNGDGAFDLKIRLDGLYTLTADDFIL